jgi:hypothetical protein
MSEPLTGKKRQLAEKFYDKLLTVMTKKKLPFMIGGTFAFNEYTGLDRPTGDIDIMIPIEEYPKILKTLASEGYKTELAEIELNWLAKITDPDGFYTDLIYAERNGLHKVEKDWLQVAREATILGHKVLLEPAEEMIRSKSYVQNRHRSDEGDVIHLILKQGKTLDWERLLVKMGPHWELLMARIMIFLFIYPSERECIPRWVIAELMGRLVDLFSTNPPKEKITRGLLLSNDFQVGTSQWGFKPITELK